MDSHQAFYEALEPEEEQLLLVRDFLYGGDWDELVADLEARRSGKPFVFKLNSRIEDDLRRIDHEAITGRAHFLAISTDRARHHFDLNGYLFVFIIFNKEGLRFVSAFW